MEQRVVIKFCFKCARNVQNDANRMWKCLARSRVVLTLKKKKRKMKAMITFFDSQERIRRP